MIGVLSFSFQPLMVGASGKPFSSAYFLANVNDRSTFFFFPATDGGCQYPRIFFIWVGDYIYKHIHSQKRYQVLRSTSKSNINVSETTSPRGNPMPLPSPHPPACGFPGAIGSHLPCCQNGWQDLARAGVSEILTLICSLCFFLSFGLWGHIPIYCFCWNQNTRIQFQWKDFAYSCQSFFSITNVLGMRAQPSRAERRANLHIFFVPKKVIQHSNKKERNKLNTLCCL